MSRVIPPRQKRSEETLARILAGAYAMLARKDLAEISMEEIAQAGGVSIGAIYRRFRSREDLLEVLMTDLQRRQLAALEIELAPDKWAGKRLAERLDWFVARQAEAVSKAPGLVRAVLASAMAPVQRDHDEVAGLNAQAAARLADWLLECGEEITAPDRQATARVVVAQLSVSLNLARLYPPTFAPMDPDAVIPILRHNALAALTGA
ncbi:MAG: hypothetical protein C0481_12650 [Phenylobacterium sp.]|uniref:TetR/AcrR family transcriptional regulator n=1 Tax=Phenylobacterium sp. TaxID=1871053 RepID=UPI0025D77CA0|nr:TetR/AcrR family transcriptional regulator [Phenylobacterium sp.]MBA4012709.1 hypothetical protein [Phenylobacterium sp.]